MKTAIQKTFAPFKIILPDFLWRSIRAFATALMTPVIFSRSSGHFKSSLLEKAVTRRGEPLPWYTYSCIDLLEHRDYKGRRVLEFGGGQSTLWWAARADSVVSIEGDPEWHAQIAKRKPQNVDLHLVSVASKEAFLADVASIVGQDPQREFDVIVIDADYREDLAAPALRLLSEDGALICDDAESYGFYEATKDLDAQRVDFFGFSPGVVLPHCTSIYYRGSCFLFDPRHPIPDLADEI